MVMPESIKKPHFWTNILVSVSIAVFGYWGNRVVTKLDNFVADYDKLHDTVIIHILLDNVYHKQEAQRNDKQDQRLTIMEEIITEGSFYYPKFEAIMREKRKQLTDNN